MARWQAVRLPMGAGAVGRMPLTPPHLCACPADKNNKREHRGFGFVTFETEAAIQVGGQAEGAGCSQSGAAAQPTPDAAYQHACCRCCLPGLPLPCTQRAPCSLALFTQCSLPLCLLSPCPLRSASWPMAPTTSEARLLRSTRLCPARCAIACPACMLCATPAEGLLTGAAHFTNPRHAGILAAQRPSPCNTKLVAC